MIRVNGKEYNGKMALGENGDLRLFILNYLDKNPKSRCMHIAEEYGTSISKVSSTMRVLVKNGIVKREVIGTEMVNFGGEMGEADIIGFSLV